jgi:hypothetical protein
VSLNISAIMNGLVSDIATLGYFERINTHEPKNAPGNGLTAALWVQKMRCVPLTSGLAVTSAYMLFTLRIYSNILQEPLDSVDPNVIEAADAIFGKYNEDFRLGGAVMCVDVLGQHGTPLSAEAGYVNQDNKLFRVMDIQLPIVIANVWTQGA